MGRRKSGSDIRAFGIAGYCKPTAIEAEVWVDMVTDGGRRFMAAWRNEEVGKSRHRQLKREATRLEKLSSHGNTPKTRYACMNVGSVMNVRAVAVDNRSVLHVFVSPS